MISLQISKSPDFTVITTFRFVKNELHLGRDRGDLLIADPELRSNHVMLEVQGSDLLIHPHRQVEHYLINGKRATAIRKLKANDEVTIGGTVFRILDFSETTIESKKNILNQKLNKLIEEDSPRLAVIERLNNLMKQ